MNKCHYLQSPSSNRFICISLRTSSHPSFHVLQFYLRILKVQFVNLMRELHMVHIFYQTTRCDRLNCSSFLELAFNSLFRSIQKIESVFCVLSFFCYDSPSPLVSQLLSCHPSVMLDHFQSTHIRPSWRHESPARSTWLVTSQSHLLDTCRFILGCGFHNNHTINMECCTEQVSGP